jgi:ubiquinone/menaquinone biosynthesis C-methylase UbiE
MKIKDTEKNEKLYDEEYFVRVHKRATSSSSFEEWDKILGCRKKEEKLDVLDAGCGTGEGMRYLSKRTKWNIKGIDLFQEASKYWEGLDAKIGDACKLEFEDNSLDLIYSSHTLAHFYDPNKFVEEAYRVLKEKGKLMIITPNLSYLKLMKPLNALGIIKYKPDPTVLNYYTLNSLTNLLTENNFRTPEAHHQGEMASLLKKLPEFKFFDRFRSRLIVCGSK